MDGREAERRRQGSFLNRLWRWLGGGRAAPQGHVDWDGIERDLIETGLLTVPQINTERAVRGVAHFNPTPEEMSALTVNDDLRRPQEEGYQAMIAIRLAAEQAARARGGQAQGRAAAIAAATPRVAETRPNEYEEMRVGRRVGAPVQPAGLRLAGVEITHEVDV